MDDWIGVDMVNGNCAQCGAEFIRENNAKYCSGMCKHQMAYARRLSSGAEAAHRARANAKYRDDPAYRERKLQRQRERLEAAARARGIEPKPKRDPVCSQIGCSRKHFALGFCRPHYYRHKAYDRNRHDYIYLKAMTPRGVQVVRCEIVPPAGMWVWCPYCGWMSMIRDPVVSLADRWCWSCEIPISLNEEEVSWLIASAA